MSPSDLTLLFLPEELSAEIQQLRELNQNLVALTAHQLTPPLSQVLAYLRMWQECEPRGQRAEIDAVLEQALLLKERLDALLLVDQLLAGLWQMERELVFIQPIITRIVDTQRARLQDKDIFLQGYINCSRPLWADQDMLYRALEELVINACKFSPPHTRIQIRVECEDKMCHIMVSDQGAGISKEMQAQILESALAGMNARRANKQQSLGIGLKLVRAIVERHDGTMAVISDPDRGSTITMMLPLA